MMFGAGNSSLSRMKKEDADFADCAEERGVSPVRPASHARLLHGRLTQVILGAFYAVHTELGYGFLEAVYSNALVVLLRGAGLKVEREVSFEIVFHNHLIGTYRADLIVESKVIIEVKNTRTILPLYKSQLLNYLRASGLQVGLVLSFGESAEFTRVVNSRSAPRPSA
jgi:GxxExxY protein